MLTASRWAANSQVFAANISNDTKNYVYVCMITAIFILIHSASINKFKITNIRFWTDGSCWSTIFASICIILDLQKSNTFNDAFYIDLCVYAIFGTTVQLCDNYMTFSRYLIVYPKSSTRFKAIVNLYIWLFLVLTYLPYETILPCFVDTNSDKVSAANTITAGYIFMVSYLSYNLFFSYKFWNAMQYKNNFGGGGNNRKLVILGAKNLLHIFISSIGVVLQGIEFSYGFAPAGCMTSYVTVNIALHFLFNWRIEKTKFPFKPNFLRSSSVIVVSSHANKRLSRLERGMSSMISSIYKDRQLSFLSQSMQVKTSNRPSNSTSMFLGGLSIKNDGNGSPHGLANQSPRLQEHQPDPIIRMPSRDSHIHPSTVETLMHPPSRDSYLAREKERGNHKLRHSIKELEGEDVEESEHLDIDLAHKSSESNLRRTMSFVLSTMFVNKIHVEPHLVIPQTSSSNTYQNNNSNNRQQRYSLTASAATTTTAMSSIFKRRESDLQNHPVKVVKVIERKLTL